MLLETAIESKMFDAVTEAARIILEQFSTGESLQFNGRHSLHHS